MHGQQQAMQRASKLGHWVACLAAWLPGCLGLTHSLVRQRQDVHRLMGAHRGRRPERVLATEQAALLRSTREG